MDRFKNRDNEEIMNFSPTYQYPFEKTNTGKNSLSYIDCTIWNENISSTTRIKVIYLWRPQNMTNFVTSHPTMTLHLQKRTLYLLFKTIESSSLLILNWKLFRITPVRRVKRDTKVRKLRRILMPQPLWKSSCNVDAALLF